MPLKTNSKQVSREINALAKGLHKSGIFAVNLSGQRVKKGIKDSILARKTIGGSGRKNIKAATAKAKKRFRKNKFGPNKKPSKTPATPLSDQGIMANVNITTATEANPKAVITPAKSREKVGKDDFNVAEHHQDDSGFGKWFGTSPEAQRDVNKINAEIGRTAIITFNKA